jgi:hypothetical protein
MHEDMIISPAYKYERGLDYLSLINVNMKIIIVGIEYEITEEIQLWFYPEPKFIIESHTDISLDIDYIKNDEFEDFDFNDVNGQIEDDKFNITCKHMRYSFDTKVISSQWELDNNIHFFGNENQQLDQVLIHLMNFDDIYSFRLDMTKINDFEYRSVNQIELKFNNWEVKIQKIVNTREISDNGKNHDAYSMTHVGKITNSANTFFSYLKLWNF